jgi:hypothetical protein
LLPQLEEYKRFSRTAPQQHVLLENNFRGADSTLVGSGLLESFQAKDMLGYRHSGFSVDTSVRI